MESILRVESLSKSYGKVSVLRDIDLTLKKGEIVGLLGRNGEGKTTLIRCLLGIIPPDRGRILYRDRPLSFRSASWRSEVGYVPEDSFFYSWMTVDGMRRLDRSFFRVREDRASSGKETEPENSAAGSSLPGRARIRTLSRGQKLRLGFETALAGRPGILFLDDPTSGLDVPTRRDFLRGLVKDFAESGSAVLFATHLIQEAEGLVDRVVILEGGGFVLDEEARVLREGARRIRVDFRAGADRRIEGPGVLEVRLDAGGAEVLVYPWIRETEESLRAKGEIGIRDEAVSLEDLFSAFVTSKGGV